MQTPRSTHTHTRAQAAEGLTSIEFQQQLLCSSNSALCPEKALEAQDELANLPMTAFWVSCSHNTYAEADQLAGTSSDAM